MVLFHQFTDTFTTDRSQVTSWRSSRLVHVQQCFLAQSWAETCGRQQKNWDAGSLNMPVLIAQSWRRQTSTLTLIC